ncbi:hypothetical protein LJR230_004932 [Trinickia sp. LjRoot230]|uniref:hypothetical protein n=1 Tax=Trinickia sp. LjRoot230 TaxID=3342288 RepID=UPI003ECCCA05
MDASPHLLPGVTARGRRAGTADDQLFDVIVLGVIDLIDNSIDDSTEIMPATPVMLTAPIARIAPAMANPSDRAVAPGSTAIEEI